MDSALAGLIGAGIGAMAGLLGSLLSNWMVIQKDEKRWFRERQAEEEKWLKERLQEIYTNCIDYLSRLFRRSEISADAGAILKQEHQRELFTDYSESQKWLGLLAIYYPTQRTDGARIPEDYKNFLKLIGDFSMGDMPDMQKAKELRSLVIAMAATDDRLQVSDKLTSKGLNS